MSAPSSLHSEAADRRISKRRAPHPDPRTRAELPISEAGGTGHTGGRKLATTPRLAYSPVPQFGNLLLENSAATA